MKASYVSTGAGGADYEADVAAALLARLLAGGSDRMLPPGLEPSRMSLQHRSGPLGFDDITVAGRMQDGTTATAYLQAKRTYSLGNTEDFRALVSSLWAHLKTDQSAWTATIVAGTITPNLVDIDDLLQSARLQDQWKTFEEVWSQSGVLNDDKRTFLGAIRKALEHEPAYAPYEVVRRLRVVAADFDVSTSLARQAAADLLAGEVTDPSTASSLLSDLRSVALRDGKLAGSYTRPSLIAALPQQYGILPSRRVREGLVAMDAAGRAALASIICHICPRQGEAAGLSLLRSKLVEDGMEVLHAHGILRIVGEGGVGKSALLRRLCERFRGAMLVLKDDRVDGRSWPAFAGQLGVMLSADEVATEFASQGPCILAIDGADRLLLSERRPVIEDLLTAISTSPLRDRWSVIASARDFQSRDLVADALTKAGLPVGRRLIVAGVEFEDVETIGQALPALKAVASRSDLGDRNRILFLLREMLTSPHLGATATEVQLADAWSTRGAASAPPDPRRDRALAQIGELVLTRPERRPGRADIDPEGLLSLEREQAVYLPPSRDAILMSHDVHEDWILARAFLSHDADLPALLRASDEPLAWLRAMRVYGQALLEDPSGPQGWIQAVARFEADPQLDPAWLRSLMVAPLYSERSIDVLNALELPLLADSGKLLYGIIETLLVAEFRLVETSPEEGSTSAPPVQYRSPILRSWAAFIRWSVWKWRRWPAPIIPLIAQVAHTWCSFTQGTNWPLVAVVVRASLSLLIEIEDCEHPENRDDRRRPFGDTKYRDWRETERLLRNAMARGAAASPDDVRSYIERLNSYPRIWNAVDDLIEHHGQIPQALPKPYTDLLIAHFTPREPRRRHEGLIGYNDCFGVHGYHEAGIRHDRGFFPPAPDHGGFAMLFEHDEAEGLRLFHRLEMRASVYLRNYARWRDRRKLRAVSIPISGGRIALWGNQFEYQWSRGVLGSHILGSCYLALDNWIWSQLEAGRSIDELCRLVLQPNGLVATAAPLICAIALKVEKPRVLDAAAPFLATPRLWDYDMQRFASLRGYQHPMGFMRLDQHFRETDVIWQRWRRRTFLAHDLLLRFHLQASEGAKALLATARESWTDSDLATYEDELDNAERMRQLGERLIRIRSDADPLSVSMEMLPGGEGLKVSIEPPAEQIEQVARAQEEQQELGKVMNLMNWVIRTENASAIDPATSLPEAIGVAKELQQLPEPKEAGEPAVYRAQMAGAAIVGTAWIAARFGLDVLLDKEGEWVAEVVVAGCRVLETVERNGSFVDDSVLAMHPLLYGARGAAALIARGRAGADIVASARLIAAGRLTEASAALLAGLDWKSQTREAWNFAVVALDRCVHRFPRSWRPNWKDEVARASQANRKLQNRSLRGSRLPWAGPPSPRRPRPVVRWQIFRTKQRRWPFAAGLARTDWTFEWTRAGKLLKVIDVGAVVADAAIASRLQRYLTELADWLQDYMGANRKKFDNHFPYEWAEALATAIGRYAAGVGLPSLWRMLTKIPGDNHARQMVGDYLEAVTSELIISQRKPDDRFWSAWREAADWLLEQHGVDGEHLEEWAAAAGLMGPYMTPLPDDWPYLDAVLPDIDRWAVLVCGSAPAALRLIKFSARLDLMQREHWLLRWAGLMVERRRGDREFWGYGGMGDTLAALLEPVSATGSGARREVRRLISVAADAGSLGARATLTRLARPRDQA